MARIPVLHDLARERIVPEWSIQIEYLAQHYPGKSELVPADPDRARQVRFLDRFFDLYVDVPMQRVVGDRLRPAGQRDPLGVEQARARFARPSRSSATFPRLRATSARARSRARRRSAPRA